MSKAAVEALEGMARRIREITGAEARVIEARPEVIRRIAPALLRRDRASLPPVLQAMHDRERKRRNRRRRAERIRRGFR